MPEIKSRNPVQKLVRLTAKPGHEAELRAALQVLESATRAEPGCVEFTFFQAISNDAQFILLEHFVDEDAFKDHMQLQHTQVFFKAQLLASVNATDVPGLGGA